MKKTISIVLALVLALALFTACGSSAAPAATEAPAEAAADAKRTIREVAYLTQAKDHPSLPASPETSYLKFLVVEVQ